MSAAAPTTTATPLPADYDERAKALAERTKPALKALGLKVGITFAAGDDKPAIVAALAKSDAAMREFGWEPLAGTGDVDANGDVIGGSPADDETPAGEAPTYDRAAVTVELDTAGFPMTGDDLAKLTDEHLANLRWQLVHVDGNDDPGDLERDPLVAWIERVGYQVPGQTTIDEQIAGKDADPVADRVATETAGDDAHIPTASQAPRTTTAPTNPAACTKCNGNGGWTVDGAFESCTECDGNEEPSGQLTLIPGGDKPSKSVLNVASLRHDLGHALEFKDGDRVLVTFELEVEKIAFIPETSGGESKRRVRTHAGTIDLDTVEITLAS